MLINYVHFTTKCYSLHLFKLISEQCERSFNSYVNYMFSLTLIELNHFNVKFHNSKNVIDIKKGYFILVHVVHTGGSYYVPF